MNLPKLVQLRKTATRLYIRAGMWSTGERSMNWTTGKYERGTSVYPAKLADDGGLELDWDDRWMYWHDYSEGLKGRLFWAGTGTEICRGTDGEPVLRCSSVVARQIPISISVHKDLIQT